MEYIVYRQVPSVFHSVPQLFSCCLPWRKEQIEDDVKDETMKEESSDDSGNESDAGGKPVAKEEADVRDIRYNLERLNHN